MMNTKHFSLPYHIRHTLPLLVSTGAALCLFLTTSKITILLEAAIFLVVAFTLVIGTPTPEKKPFCPGAALLALSFEAVGFYTFFSAWQHSGILVSLAERVSVPASVVAGVIAGLGCIAGWYAFYRLARWMEERIAFLWGGSYSRSSLGAMLTVSALCFFFRMPEITVPTALYGVSAVIVCAMVAFRIPEGQFRSAPRWMHILSAFSAVGICLFRVGHADVSGIFGLLLCVPFVYACLLLFYRYLADALSGVFSGMVKAELLFYGALFLILTGAMAAIFLSTDAFYGTVHPYDVIYTSDSPILMGSNTWLNLTYSQNDLRQPLFAVFAAPFMGLSYLLEVLTGADDALSAILMNIPQLGILVLTCLILAASLELSGIRRAGFVLLCCCSYAFLLFGLMMEQYIFACFYLVLFARQLCRGQKPGLTFCGAGGTLLTSVIAIPLLSDHHPVKAFPLWYRDMLNRAMEFVILMIAFCRLDIILGIADQIVSMGQFTGEALTLADKLWQYLAFVPGCLFSPAAGVDMVKVGFPSWQLAVAEDPHWGGILILLLCFVSLWLNRDQAFSRFCGGWTVFSFLLLFGLGWGTQENGLVLYALYFGWAYLVLLYQLISWLEQKFRIPHLTPIATALGIAAMALCNFPAMADMITFALTHYPL